MKRRLGYMAIAVGLISWMWIGSYGAIRFAHFNPHGNNCFIRVSPGVKPLTGVYGPLAAIDEKTTGTPVLFFSDWSELFGDQPDVEKPYW